MTKKIGFLTTGANQDTYLYIENAAGESLALGTDVGTGTFNVNTLPSPGAFPDEATSNIAIDAAANGDIVFLPNGTGDTYVISGDIDISTGSLRLPSTNASLSAGTIQVSGTPVIHFFGNDNIFLVREAGNATTTSFNNIGMGFQALNDVTGGNRNIAIGLFALDKLTGGDNNIGLGNETGEGALTTGSYNILIGNSAGTNLSFTSSSNICIGNAGDAGSNAIYIGTSGSGQNQHNQCFLAGVYNITPTGGLPTEFVVINADGQLGTTASSALLTYTSVDNASSPYTVLAPDEFISVDASAGVVTILLPNSTTQGRVVVIKDRLGQAGTFNITVSTVGGSVTIDGSTSFVMNTAYQSIDVLFNGLNYEVF